MKESGMPGLNKFLVALMSIQLLLVGHANGEESSNEDEGLYQEFLIETTLPFSEDAREEIVDVQSPFVWQTYQAGTIDGWHYRFSPDGSAIFSRSPRLHDNAYRVNCRRRRGCTITTPDGNKVNVFSFRTPLQAGEKDEGLSVAYKYVAWLFENSKALRPKEQATKNDPTGGTPQRASGANEKRFASIKKEENKNSRRTTSSLPHEVAKREKNRKPRPDKKSAASLRDRPKAKEPSHDRTKDRKAGETKNNEIALLPPDNSPINAFTKKPGKLTSCAFSVEYGIKYFDDESSKKKSGKEKLALTCGGTLFSNLTIRGSINYYPEPDKQQPWDPDYTFSATYHYSKNINLEYSNYSGNRFPWHQKDGTGGLGSGSFRISYATPEAWNQYVDGRLPFINKLKCATSVSTSPQYQKENGSGTWKTLLGLSCSLVPLSFDRVNIVFTGLYYPFPGQKQSWDPDYTLSVGYKLSEKLSLGYSNYSGGRWPWSKDQGVGEGLSSGSLRMTYKID